MEGEKQRRVAFMPGTAEAVFEQSRSELLERMRDPLLTGYFVVIARADPARSDPAMMETLCRRGFMVRPTLAEEDETRPAEERLRLLERRLMVVPMWGEYLRLMVDEACRELEEKLTQGIEEMRQMVGGDAA